MQIIGQKNNQISLKGICEINLSDNLLTCNCVADLCQFLQFDRWTRTINLRNNDIGYYGISQICSMLEFNESIICMDLRDNPGFDEIMSNEIFKKLMLNIKKIKNR